MRIVCKMNARQSAHETIEINQLKYLRPEEGVMSCIDDRAFRFEDGEGYTRGPRRMFQMR
jgi:hypothetical protein